MKLSKYKKKANSLRKATLCFIVDGDKVLLGMKKRGFATGKWNGFGGKKNDGESVEEAAIRETQEESGIVAKDAAKVAVLHFYFTHNDGWNQQVTVYTIKNWDGEIVETEEMRPQWFGFDELPFEKMWDGDDKWIPLVLKGKRVVAHTLFNGKSEVLEQEIQMLEELE